MLDIYRSAYNDSLLTVEIIITKTSSGIVVQLLGGDSPHIGATVISHPRPSLVSADQISCNTIVIPELGHKEDELAKPLSERLAITLNCTVVLVAGIHVDNASGKTIKKISAICRELVEEYLTFACKGL